MIILLVEDDKDLLAELVDSLVEYGHTVIPFANAEEALDSLTNLPIEALITDMRLPGISGKQLIAKAAVLNPLIHCVLISGHIPETEYSENYHILSKPFSINLLLTYLNFKL